MVIGVTGLPAAGKSTVARLFGDLGAAVADADAIAHAVLDDPVVRARVRREVAPGIPDAPAAAVRAGLAAVVFSPGREAALRRLEGILHPEVRRRLRAAVARARADRRPAVVLDAPLLFEGGADGLCDVTVFVEAPRRVRLRRVAARGWDAAALRARDEHQWPAAARRRRATAVVRNGGSEDAARRAVRRMWRRWVEGAAPAAPPRRTS